MKTEQTPHHQDRYRPELHFSPAFGWLNDPNGLVYHDGIYHLFYQYCPDKIVWGPMHWGHATSSDLIRWKHQPIALMPDELGTCFSGSAVVDADNSSGLFDECGGLLAFYTASKASDQPDLPDHQTQCLAFSADGGKSWQKHPANPIIENPGIEAFRDPKVFWHAQTQHWVMVLTHGQSIGIYLSRNALNWELASEFGTNDGCHTQGPWECPDLFPLYCEQSQRTYWVLVVGIGEGCYTGGSGTQYFIGEFDGQRFTNLNPPETVLWMDWGRDFYAVQSWSDAPDGRRLAIAWMSNWQYARNVPADTFRSIMTLPRELILKPTPQGPRLAQRFVHSLERCALEDPALSLAQTRLAAEQALSLGQWDTPLLLSAELELAPGSELSLSLSDQGETGFRFRCDEHGQLTLYCTRAVQSDDPLLNEVFPHHYAIVLEQAGNRLSLQLLVDRTSAELLLMDGEISVSNSRYPDSPDTQLNLSCLQGQALLLGAECCALSAQAMTYTDSE